MLAGFILLASYGIADDGGVADSGAAGVDALRSAIALLNDQILAQPNPDAATASALGVLQTRAGAALADLDDLTDASAARTVAQRAGAVRTVFGILDDARRVVETDLAAAAGLNSALTMIGRRLDGISFEPLEDAVWGIEPYKLRRDGIDPEVSLFGYFPSIQGNGDAVVRVRDIPVSVRRSAGGITFRVPAGVMTDLQGRVPVTITAPAKRWQWRPRTLVTWIRLSRQQPFEFSIELFASPETPYATISGRPSTHRVDAVTPSRLLHLDTVALFRETVGDPRYDEYTATLIDVQVMRASGDRACDTCPPPMGAVTQWNAEGLDLSLTAPRCDYQIVRRPCQHAELGVTCTSVCRGGGSEYRLTFVPTFTVRVRQTLPGTALPRNLVLEPNRVTRLPLPAGIKAAVLHLLFDDGFARAETRVAIGVNRVIRTPLFTAQLDGNVLTLTTN